MGEGPEEAGALAILSPRHRRREGAAGTRPCSDPGRGNREGRRQGEAGRFGRMGQVGRPGCELGRLVQGDIFFSFCFTLSYFSFSVLANCLGTK